MTPEAVAAQLGAWLGDQEPVLLRRGDRPLRKLVLALDYAPGHVPDDADGLFLHRPFDWPPDSLPGVSVFASHTGFDRHLTTGHHPALAAALGLVDMQLLNFSDGARGMVGRLEPPMPWIDWIAGLTHIFGGLEAVADAHRPPISRVVVADAMREATINEAVAQGAQCYVTGQVRVPGARAADRAGLGYVALGHRRSEAWGLRQLASRLRAEFPTLEVEVSD